MPAIIETDWYKYPVLYDIVFDNDTPQETDFLEAVHELHGPRNRRNKPLQILEPACGTGRLMFELAARGHRTAGFDLSEEMVAHVLARAASDPAAVRRRVRVSRQSMQAFRFRAPFDLAHCMLSTFKYLLSEDDALACLERLARVLVPGGLFVFGIHLTDYSRRRLDREVWRGSRNGVSVACETITRPADPATRLEWLRNRLRIRRNGTPGSEVLETNWQCRTYDAAELERLLKKVPAFEIVGCYDFTHDIEAPRGLDDSQEDLVVVLKKRVRPNKSQRNR